MRFNSRSLSRTRFWASLMIGLPLAFSGCAAPTDPVAALMTAPAEARRVLNPGPNCTLEQHAVVADAFYEARVHLGRAVAFMHERPHDSHVQYWFGKASADAVLATLEATVARMDRSDGVRLECNDARVCSDGKIAYARLRSGRLGVCPRFFEVGLSGLDSRFGILIHEMTHVAARTGDHAYRPRAAAHMAQTNPVLAAHNADNYQYFVETLPAANFAARVRGLPVHEPVGGPVSLRGTAGNARVDSADW